MIRIYINQSKLHIYWFEYITVSAFGRKEVEVCDFRIPYQISMPAVDR